MTYNGPQLDDETRTIREILLFRSRANVPGGTGFQPIKGVLYKSLCKASDEFLTIQKLAIQSNSAKDPVWRKYMLGDDAHESQLAHDWFVDFARLPLGRANGPAHSKIMRGKLDDAFLTFAGFFIPEASKHLAHELRTLKSFHTAEVGKPLYQIGFAAFDRICGKAQVFAGLQALGYPVSGAIAGDLPAYLGALNALAEMLEIHFPLKNVSREAEVQNRAALAGLSKGELSILLSAVLEKRRLSGVRRELITKEDFATSVADLAKTLCMRAKGRQFASQMVPYDVPVQSLTIKRSEHSPRRILEALDLYFAAVAGSSIPDSIEDAFDPYALHAIPWLKLRHQANLAEKGAYSLSDQVGATKSGHKMTRLDVLATQDGTNEFGYPAVVDAEDHALIAKGHIAEPSQADADRRVLIRLAAGDGPRQLVARTLLHHCLPELKEHNNGARNGFIISYRGVVDAMVVRLLALRDRDPNVPHTPNPNQTGNPTFQTKNDAGIGPYVDIAIAFVSDSFKRIHGRSAGENK